MVETCLKEDLDAQAMLALKIGFYAGVGITLSMLRDHEPGRASSLLEAEEDAFGHLRAGIVGLGV
jgi:hypothetical protein